MNFSYRLWGHQMIVRSIPLSVVLVSLFQVACSSQEANRNATLKTGEEVCEGHGFDQTQCEARKVCCVWNGKECRSAIGKEFCMYAIDSHAGSSSMQSVLDKYCPAISSRLQRWAGILCSAVGRHVGAHSSFVSRSAHCLNETVSAVISRARGWVCRGWLKIEHKIPPSAFSHARECSTMAGRIRHALVSRVHQRVTEFRNNHPTAVAYVQKLAAKLDSINPIILSMLSVLMSNTATAADKWVAETEIQSRVLLFFVAAYARLIRVIVQCMRTWMGIRAARWLAKKYTTLKDQISQPKRMMLAVGAIVIVLGPALLGAVHPHQEVGR
eukprot:gnl/MRDRNA2_/MRDRNA2_126838_c0_seq1.p1 gnl/MRDRNA2_/MRDRNA2_126838_c0~~gnl/MRDRNA2_/MRDRNA2_126838_c0_seq1.p1  ORF type:complete len:327 (+),score=33.52 gnl/MRDRNA2_/MRDRNA2_126838_c0_seq1:110-1090(+)